MSIIPQTTAYNSIICQEMTALVKSTLKTLFLEQLFILFSAFTSDIITYANG